MSMDLEDIQAASSEAVVGSEDSAAVVGNDDPALSVKADADAATDQVMESSAAYVVPVNVESIRESSLSLAESLEDINGQVDRLASLTNDLVYLSRMEEAGSAITMTEIPVSDIVSETADSFSALALERKKSLDIQVTPMLSMQGSSKEIEKLVSILVENALKYSVEDDSVHISLKKEGKNIVLEVGNKAAEPLSDEDLAHVFDRFYRGDKSRNSASGGHGIGLSMASAIVAAHGGKIRARSGDGTEFIVTATMPAA
jgi:signal transduction histidine kinase